MELTKPLRPTVCLEYQENRHHPFLYDHIDETTKTRRRLTRISLGMNPIEGVEKFLPLSFHTKKLRDGEFKLRYNKFILRVSTKEEAFDLSCRLYRLSVFGFFNRLTADWEKIDNVTLSFERLGNRKIVVYHGLSHAVYPSDWMSLEAYQEVVGIIKRIENGTWVLRVDDAHPGKQQIIKQFKVIASVPSGRELFFRLNTSLKQVVTISYKKGQLCYSRSEGRILIDHTTRREGYTIDPLTNRITPYNASLAAVIVHEALHVLCGIYQFHINRVFSPGELIKRAVYLESSRCYVSDVGDLHRDFTNLEEQLVIMGVTGFKCWLISENMFNLELGEGPLRYGHRKFNKYELEASPYVIKSDKPLEKLIGISPLELALSRGEKSPIDHLMESADRKDFGHEIVTTLEKRLGHFKCDDLIKHLISSAIKKGFIKDACAIHLLKLFLLNWERNKNPFLVHLIETILLPYLETKTLSEEGKQNVGVLLGKILPWIQIDLTFGRIERILGMTRKRPAIEAPYYLRSGKSRKKYSGSEK